jgi:hypothetical protein
MFKTTLYLDFDGVLNAKKPAHALISKFAIAIKDSLHLASINHITFSPYVIQDLDKLRVQYQLELVWLTTWNEKDNVLKLSEPLGGLRNGRVLAANLNQKALNKKEWTQWKADAIIADQRATPRPFVWVDDNAHQFHSEVVNAETKIVPSLFLTPVSLTGLTVRNLEELKDFLKSIG